MFKAEQDMGVPARSPFPVGPIRAQGSAELPKCRRGPSHPVPPAGFAWCPAALRTKPPICCHPLAALLPCRWLVTTLCAALLEPSACHPLPAGAAQLKGMARSRGQCASS